MTIAHKLSKYSLGDRLLDAAKTHSPSGLEAFLITWRADLRSILQNDPDGHIGQKCGAVARAVSDTFPDPNIVRAYVMPLTSWSDGADGPKLPPAGHLDLAKLATFCEQSFGWGTPSGIIKKFSNLIWEGACLRMLCEVCTTLNPPIYDNTLSSGL